MTQQATFYETIIDEHVQHHDDYPTFSSPLTGEGGGEPFDKLMVNSW